MKKRVALGKQKFCGRHWILSGGAASDAQCNRPITVQSEGVLCGLWALYNDSKKEWVNQEWYFGSSENI